MIDSYGETTGPRVSLVIPARDEAPNLPWVLRRVPDIVDEIVLVDGRSTDGTVEVACAVRPDIRVVHQEGRGKGDALRLGFEAARGERIVMIDADGSMSPTEIPRFIDLLDRGYDVVKGSRFADGGCSTDITILRRAGNLALLGLFNRLYASGFSDLCYGYIAFDRSHLSRLDMSCPGFEVEAQLLISAIRARLRVTEVGSCESPRLCGDSNLRTFRDGSRVLRTVVGSHDRGLSGLAVQRLRSALWGRPAHVPGRIEPARPVPIAPAPVVPVPVVAAPVIPAPAGVWSERSPGLSELPQPT
ncbi:glycosyltransferase family 2 protein [Actinomycetospora atypica]|uniref:Glycosyltransferase family 2 protein n=1 Tax=Actinomycetospora atypica TaxID=1290095 RepID=A0ABV9YFP2_9PSEU